MSGPRAGIGPAGAGPVVSVVLSPEARSVGEARRLVAGVCTRAGVDREAAVTAAVLTSEVVTNAVLHGRSRVRFAVSVTAAGLLVEVGDDNSRAPVLRRRDDDALDGRGVALLAGAASRWGVRPEAEGKVVWFLVATG